MKKSLIIAAALLALVIPARADQLPAIYLGQWCQLNAVDNTDYYIGFEPGGECHATDRITITRNELTEHESGCHFRSIKRTNDLRANNTKPTKAEWTPVMEVLAHCEGE